MKYKLKYILILGIACLAFMSIDDVYALSSVTTIKGAYYYDSGPKYLDFSFSNSGTIANWTFPVINSVNFVYETDNNSMFWLYRDEKCYKASVDINAPSINHIGEFESGWTSSGGIDGDAAHLFYIDSTYVSPNKVHLDFYYSMTCNAEKCYYPSVAFSKTWANIKDQPFYSISSSNQPISISNSTMTSYSCTAIQEEMSNRDFTEVKDSIDKVDDTIKDSDTSGAGDTAGGFFDSFEDSDYGLSDIITLPLQTINNMSSATCSPLTFPIPFVDTQMSLPCMTDIYSQFGPILTIYQTITFGMIAYWVVVNIFATIRNFKNPDSDEIEVVNL